jgi:hypothetical protein
VGEPCGRGRRRATIAAVLAFAAVALGACGGGSNGGTTGGTPSSEPASSARGWDPRGANALRNFGGDLRKAMPGQCARVSFTDQALMKKGMDKLGDKIRPLAVGSCDLFDESAELTAFRTAADRDGWVEERTRLICGRAAKAEVDLPGLRFVVTKTLAIQPDSEANARRIAAAIGGEYHPSPCPGQRLDWSPAAVTVAEGLARKVAGAVRGCTDLTLADRDAIRDNPAFKQAGGLPAAIASCSAGDARLTFVVTNRSSVSLARFLDPQLTAACRTAPDTAVVTGTDWVVLGTTPANSQSIAEAAGGTIRRCPR